MENWKLWILVILNIVEIQNFGNLKLWKYEIVEIGNCVNVELWKLGIVEIRKCGNCGNEEIELYWKGKVVGWVETEKECSYFHRA